MRTRLVRLVCGFLLPVAWLLLAWPALAAGGGPTMPALDGGTVWVGEGGVFQQWDDGSWVYVWRPLPGEGPPETRWPERVAGPQRDGLAFAGRRWRGGDLVVPGEDPTGDRVVVLRDEGGEWTVALYVPGAALDARAASIVGALQGISLEGD